MMATQFFLRMTTINYSQTCSILICLLCKASLLPMTPIKERQSIFIVYKNFSAINQRVDMWFFSARGCDWLTPRTVHLYWERKYVLWHWGWGHSKKRLIDILINLFVYILGWILIYLYFLNYQLNIFLILKIGRKNLKIYLFTFLPHFWLSFNLFNSRFKFWKIK